ncbi:restriction endonuclease subunit S [Arcanobacterium ihumii]|uniref:restriction endonuclease subunit S n=1 Tax=Arcanobacterium ihumii TaxID=2138162 RepID=UPI000F54044B|nr:restriction endonuclease subunit S [Arcanobacterium ihumii]
MSRIDDLIKGLCPNGVEFRRLATLGTRNAGISITAAKMKEITVPDGEIRVFAGGNTIADVSYNSVPSDRVIESPSIIVKSRGHIGFTYYDKPFTHKSELWSYSLNDPCINQKFVYYYLLTQVDFLSKKAKATSVKLPQLSITDTDDLNIPIPPLEVQEEIVRILDSFTQLEAELEARKKQYAYYRDSLLTFPEFGGGQLTLADIVTKVSSGATPKAGSTKYYYSGTIPWLRTGEVDFQNVYDTEIKITQAAVSETGVKLVPSNTVVVAISGATAGKSAVIKVPMYTNQHCCNLQINSKVAEYRYVFYWLAAHYEELKSLGRGARKDLNASVIKSFPIVLPTLEDQHRIVSILDKFDALVNDISSGLPAEIEARRKQYEYYRDKLLSFEELPA